MSDLFDPRSITPETKPTREEVLRMLEQGKLERANISYGDQKLQQQFDVIVPVVTRSLPAFEKADLGVGVPQLVLGYRLCEIIAPAMAERITLTVDVEKQTAAQQANLKVLREGRDDLVRLARARKVPEKLFRVNLGEGDASRALPGARTLVELVERHGAKLNAPAVVAEILADLRKATKEMEDAQTLQEAGKREKTLPTATMNAAREALYALLLTFSRLGPVANRKNPELRDQFELTLLKSNPGGPGSIDDDDEPAPAPAEPVAPTGTDPM